MEEKTFDLVNLSEDTVLDIIVALVRNKNSNTAFSIYCMAYPDESWNSAYKYIAKLEKVYE